MTYINSNAGSRINMGMISSIAAPFMTVASLLMFLLMTETFSRETYSLDPIMTSVTWMVLLGAMVTAFIDFNVQARASSGTLSFIIGRLALIASVPFIIVFALSAFANAANLAYVALLVIVNIPHVAMWIDRK